MLELITSINKVLNDFIWGVPAMACIIGVGLYLSIRSGFLQLRKFGYSMKCTVGRIFERKKATQGAMTSFQAVCTALAATVGTGNIAGVAGAIAMCCFALSTIVGWGLYGARCAEFLLGSKILLPFNIAYALISIVGATVDLGLVWGISDTFNGFMTVPNLIGVFSLAPVVLKLTKEHFEK